MADRPKRGTPAHLEWLAAHVRACAEDLGVPVESLLRDQMREWPARMGRGVARADVDGFFGAARDRAAGMRPARTAKPATVDARVSAHVERDRLREAGAREREHLEEIARLRAALDTAQSVAADAPPPRIQTRERAYGLREATMLALASDWHVEEYVDPAKIGGVNAYDLAIAQSSARRFFDALVWLYDHHSTHFAIRDLVLWLGGDLIGGYIHDELVETNALAPLPAIRFARDLIGAGIRMLLAETQLERIVIPCSYGNHGRTTAKSRIVSGAENSFETHLYHALAADFAGEPRVAFVIARGPLLYLDVYDYVVRFTHGDSVKYGGGVGGISIPINKAIAGWDSTRRAHLTCMGHWHQYLHGQRALVNGSLIGHSPFSDWIKAQFEPPRQAFCLIDSRRGPCMSTPIWVREDEPVHRLRPADSDAIRERVLAGREAA